MKPEVLRECAKIGVVMTVAEFVAEQQETAATVHPLRDLRHAVSRHGSTERAADNQAGEFGHLGSYKPVLATEFAKSLTFGKARVPRREQGRLLWVKRPAILLVRERQADPRG